MHTDNESVEQYLYLARHWIMDTLSTIAVEQKTGNIIGFIICRFNELSNKDPVVSRERVIIKFNRKKLITLNYQLKFFVR